MGRLSNAFKSLGGFVTEVRSELKKSSWPTRQELLGSTGVIIVSVILLGAFVGASDRVLSVVIGLIVQ